MKMAMKLLRSARDKRGYSQEYVADKLGVSSSTISRWESGTSKVTMDNLLRYADFLEVDREDVCAVIERRLPNKPTPIAQLEVEIFTEEAYNRVVELIQTLGIKHATITATKRLR